jgi:glycolate oxidase iron-sulfur subunit
LPDNQGCCGIPALSSGDLPTFQKLLAHSLARFEAGAFDYLGHRLRHLHIHHPRGVAEDGGRTHRERAARLARRTMDINQFLVREVGFKAPAEISWEPPTVTYHDPCHLKKSLKVFTNPVP